MVRMVKKGSRNIREILDAMSQIKRNTRNNSLDSLKLICALLVVFIHCNYPYKSELLPITDVAVPLFFCISGYLIFGVKRNCTRIGRIGKIFAWVFVLYLLKTEAFRLTTSHQLFIPTFEDIIHLVCFNDVVFSIHLWYLPTSMC